MSQISQPISKPAVTVDAPAPSAAYEAPRLTALGDVRDLTLGGSAGTGDSGNPGLQQF